jgi:hypothetical protein
MQAFNITALCAGNSPQVLTKSWCASRRSHTNSSSDSSLGSPVSTCSSVACDIQHEVAFSSMLNHWAPPSFSFSLNECFVDDTPPSPLASSRCQSSHRCDAFSNDMNVASIQRPQQQTSQQNKRKHNDAGSEFDKKTCYEAVAKESVNCSRRTYINAQNVTDEEYQIRRHVTQA